MTKLLIVDDEPLVQVGIKSMLNWQELNIQLCGTAANGEIALEIIEKEMPDIVISDIKMPIMDGLALLRTCNEKYGYQKPLFIMLTSYEDFQMAKEAFVHHAFSYLVKVELTPASLKDTILKAQEVLRNQAVSSSASADKSATVTNLYSYTEKFLISLLNNLFESEEQMRLQADHLKINLTHSGYLCCYGAFSSGSAGNDRQKLALQYETSLQMVHELVEKYYPCHTLALDISHFALILALDDPSVSAGGLDEFMEKLKSILLRIRSSLLNYYSVDISCGIGSLTTTPMGLPDSFQNARLAFRQTNPQSPIQSIPEEDEVAHDTFNISLFKEDLTRSFEEYDSQLLHDTLHLLVDLLCSHPHHYVQALDAASNILYLSLSLLREGEQILGDIFAEDADGYLSLYKQNTVEQVCNWLLCLEDGLGQLFDHRKKDYKNRIVIDVKSYINEHLYEKLSLNEVAAQFAVSSSYLSQLFSRYNDIGFSEYINYVKIQESKHLLRDEHQKVYEVAEQLSFGSEFYFSKVFKKVEGISPTEFLNSSY